MRCLILALFLCTTAARADQKTAEALQALDAAAMPADGEKGKKPPDMLRTALNLRRQDANYIETKIWQLRIRNKTDWEEYRDTRIARLRRSLGQYPEPPKELKVQVTRTIKGDGYAIDNLVFESRPGLTVTANFYRPQKYKDGPPGILIIPSHHNPKTQVELQDMGMTWAREGCLVLVADQLGHGERRQHPFQDKGAFDGDFKVGRQDYYFRYNSSLQLYLLGDSLMGWMAWDYMRCIDLLLQKGCGKDKIILLGAVAGGGDPAGVVAALDKRISAVAPFNFGGPQPETTLPLPADSEMAFNYAGGGSWESTRGLAFSARDGFLPWVIVGSVAPRGLIHAHEFAWDKDRDPVWKRYQTIFKFYDAADKLAYTHGKGSVRGTTKEDTHCNNIGAYHRKPMYPTFDKWFGMKEPVKEYQERHPSADLQCWTKDTPMKPLHELAQALAKERLAPVRTPLEKGQPAAKWRKAVQDQWADRLGWIDPKLVPGKETAQAFGDGTLIRTVLSTEANIDVPVALFLPKQVKKGPVPVVVAVAQAGKQGFLKERAGIIAELLDQGVAVCLPDVRGTGETNPGGGRSRTSTATSLSALALMVGQPLLGGRLRDVRAVLAYLRQRQDLDGKRIGLWGDSFAPVNEPTRNLRVPWDAGKLPEQAEPLGGLLALLTALYEPEVKTVYVRRGLLSFQAILDSPFLYVPHDVIVPGALTASDLDSIAAALTPRPMRLEQLVDGRNVVASQADLNRFYGVVATSYRQTGSTFETSAEPSADSGVARWLVQHVSAK